MLRFLALFACGLVSVAAGADRASAQTAQAKFTMKLTLALHGVTDGGRILEVRVTTKDVLRQVREVVGNGKIEPVFRRDVLVDPPQDLIAGQTVFLVNGEPFAGAPDSIVPLAVELPGFASRAESEKRNSSREPLARVTRALHAFQLTGLQNESGTPLEATLVGLNNSSSKLDRRSGALLFASQSEQVFGGITAAGPDGAPVGVLTGTLEAGPEKILQ